MKEIEVKCIIDDKKGEYSKIYRLELENGEAIKILKQGLKAGGCISGLDLVILQQAIIDILAEREQIEDYIPIKILQELLEGREEKCVCIAKKEKK